MTRDEYESECEELSREVAHTRRMARKWASPDPADWPEEPDEEDEDEEQIAEEAGRRAEWLQDLSDEMTDRRRSGD